MSLIRNLSAFAFAGAVGIAGSASARPVGQPPEGSLRPELSVRMAHDGRGDTGGDPGRNTIARGWIEKSDRPDNNVGQARHFALPIKSDIAMRVTLGDGRESSQSSALNHSKTENQSASVKAFYKRPELPIPFKSDIIMQVSGGEVSMDANADRNSDDPKKARVGTETGTHMNPKVYPGRHEHKPAVFEMFMKVQKRQSASSDAAGDKDAG